MTSSLFPTNLTRVSAMAKPGAVGLALTLLIACTGHDGSETEMDLRTGTTQQDLFSSEWDDYGGTVTDVAISSENQCRLDIWAIAGGAVWHRSVNNTSPPSPPSAWDNWAGKPGNTTLTGVAAVYRDGETDIVVTDSTGKIWSNTWATASWSWAGWGQVGSWAGTAVGKPAASAVQNTNTLHVWVRGTDNNLWRTQRIGTQAWSGWTNQGSPSGGLASAPAAITRSESPLEVGIAVGGTSFRTWYGTSASGGTPTWALAGQAVQFSGSPSIAKQGNDITILRPVGFRQLTQINPGNANISTISTPSNVNAGLASLYINGGLEIVMEGNTGNVWRKAPINQARAQAIVGFYGKCVGVDATNRAILTTCTGTPEQAWTWNGETIRNVLIGKCLNVSGGLTANSSPVIAYTCSASPQPNERWAASNGSLGSSPVQIVGVGSGKCLNVPNNNPSDGTQLIIYDCWNLPNDRWHAGNGIAKRIWVKAYALRNADTTNPTTVTEAAFRNALTQVNELFLRAQIQFELAEWIVRNDSTLNNIGDSATQNEDSEARNLAKTNPGFITVLLRNGGGFSGPPTAGKDGDYVMAGNDQSTGIAHEFGHYFGLVHTFPPGLDTACPNQDCYNNSAWTVFQNSSSLDPNVAFDGDGLDDTPGDPGPWVFERRAGQLVTPPIIPGIGWDSCGLSDWIDIFDTNDTTKTTTVRPDRRNLESYFKHCGAGAGDLTLSPKQIATIKTALLSDQRVHLTMQ